MCDPMSISLVPTPFDLREARDPIALCLGWDVGGWHGRKDGLGAVALYDDGTLHRVGHGKQASLGRMIAAGVLALEDLLGMVGMLRSDPWPRILIGIDAPLGLPEAFVESTAGRITNASPRLGELPIAVIENRLAYRDTERAVFAEYKSYLRPGWRPLSPSFDGMGSNVSKARAAVSQLRFLDSARVCLVPFESDAKTVAVLEVYPALWSAIPEPELDSSAARVLEVAKTEASPDVRDGLLCALSAACYERTRLHLGVFPEVILPPDNERIKVEGWIYAPRPGNRLTVET